VVAVKVWPFLVHVVVVVQRTTLDQDDPIRSWAELTSSEMVPYSMCTRNLPSKTSSNSVSRFVGATPTDQRLTVVLASSEVANGASLCSRFDTAFLEVESCMCGQIHLVLRDANKCRLGFMPFNHSVFLA
jgi:hypothetical protein